MKRGGETNFNISGEGKHKRGGKRIFPFSGGDLTTRQFKISGGGTDPGGNYGQTYIHTDRQTDIVRF